MNAPDGWGEGVPPPECMEPAEAREWAHALAECAAEFRSVAQVLEDVATIFELTAKGMDARKAGRIVEAGGYESWASARYRRLPQWARW